MRVATVPVRHHVLWLTNYSPGLFQELFYSHFGHKRYDHPRTTPVKSIWISSWVCWHICDFCSSSYWVQWTMTGGQSHSHSVTYHAVWGLLSSPSMSKRYDLRSSSMADDKDTSNMEGHKCILDSDSFRIHLLESLSDEVIASKLQCIFTPSFNRLTEAVNDLVKKNQSLKQQLLEKDTIINQLQHKCEYLESKMDDREQWGRWGSMRIQGLPEQGTGKVEEKILALCNEALELQPPLQLEDIKVTHRLPRPADRTPKPPASQEHPTPGSGARMLHLSHRTRSSLSSWAVESSRMSWNFVKSSRT